MMHETPKSSFVSKLGEEKQFKKKTKTRKELPRLWEPLWVKRLPLSKLPELQK